MYSLALAYSYLSRVLSLLIWGHRIFIKIKISEDTIDEYGIPVEMNIGAMVSGHLPVQTPLILPKFVHVVGSHETTEVCHEHGNATSLNVGFHEIENSCIGFSYDAWIRDEYSDWLVLRICEPSSGWVRFAGAYDAVLLAQ